MPVFPVVCNKRSLIRTLRFAHNQRFPHGSAPASRPRRPKAVASFINKKSKRWPLIPGEAVRLPTDLCSRGLCRSHYATRARPSARPRSTASAPLSRAFCSRSDSSKFHGIICNRPNRRLNKPGTIYRAPMASTLLLRLHPGAAGIWPVSFVDCRTKDLFLTCNRRWSKGKCSNHVQSG